MHDVHTRKAHYQWVSTEMACRFLTIASLMLWWSTSRLPCSLVRIKTTNSRATFSSLLPSFVRSSSCLMWYSHNYSRRASTYRGDAGALIRGWRQRTRCPRTRPPQQPTEASVAAVPAAMPTSTRSSSAA